MRPLEEQEETFKYHLTTLEILHSTKVFLHHHASHDFGKTIKHKTDDDTMFFYSKK